jgi:hypothetical protein
LFGADRQAAFVDGQAVVLKLDLWRGLGGWLVAQTGGAAAGEGARREGKQAAA